MLGDERRDVIGVLLLAGRHHLEDAVFLTPPVRAQQGLHLLKQVRDRIPITPVERAQYVIGAVERLLVLGDVVPDQRQVTATAVVTHRNRRYPIRNARFTETQPRCPRDAAR